MLLVVVWQEEHCWPYALESKMVERAHTSTEFTETIDEQRAFVDVVTHTISATRNFRRNAGEHTKSADCGMKKNNFRSSRYGRHLCYANGCAFVGCARNVRYGQHCMCLPFANGRDCDAMVSVCVCAKRALCRMHIYISSALPSIFRGVCFFPAAFRLVATLENAKSSPVLLASAHCRRDFECEPSNGSCARVRFRSLIYLVLSRWEVNHVGPATSGRVCLFMLFWLRPSSQRTALLRCFALLPSHANMGKS